MHINVYKLSKYMKEYYKAICLYIYKNIKITIYIVIKYVYIPILNIRRKLYEMKPAVLIWIIGNFIFISIFFDSSAKILYHFHE